MSTLYSNLNTEDSASVVTELGAMGVKFDVKNGGAEILVESQDVLKVRMILAEKGLPSKASIVGYEIFDKENLLGTSNFVMNVNLIRALEGELSRTISALSSIKSARVHIVMPRKDIFKRQDIEPSASVVLNLNNRLDVPKEEALSVKHLVSSSIPGLKPSKVTIVDNNGKILAKAKNAEDQMFGSSNDSAEYKFKLEERYRNIINSLLGQAVGAGKVETQVSVDVSFEKVTVSSESYDPDSQVARSVQNTEMVSSSTDPAGEVSVATELTGEAALDAATSSEQKTDEIANYEISKTITNRVNDTGKVEKISVAVLVDGKYVANEEGEENYVPRSDEELDQIQTLVRSAIGYNEARGDEINVVNMQFSRESAYLLPEEGPFDWLKRDLDSIIKTLVLGIVAVLGIMLVVRPLVNKAFDISSKDLEEEELRIMAENEALAQQAGTNMDDDQGEAEEINIDAIQSKVDYSPAQKVNDLIDNNTDETLSVIRSWLANNR
jgi:flagellar M-ring protein FliF